MRDLNWGKCWIHSDQFHCYKALSRSKGLKGDFKYIWPKTSIPEEANLTVPKILHFIWFGDPIPRKYIENINKFVEHNKDYQVSINLEDI